ncbi:MAG TPA: RDD family protein [Bryobacteraceae bacterium]|nr:RDD family protein [Bryobacteraceae bacterium]
MTCSYCGTRSGEGEHRCRRCGRKPDDTLTGEFSLVSTDGALAAQFQPVLEPAEPAEKPAPRIVARSGGHGPSTRPTGGLARAIQPSLFQDRPNTKVVAIADYAPPPARPKAAPRNPAKPSQRRPRPVPEEQGQLPFLPPQAAKPRTLSTTVDSVIFCEAPVATTLHRLVAAALDWALVLIAYGLFLAVFHALGGQFELNRTNAMVFGGMLLVTGFAYGITWTMAGCETAGMHWMKLRLTTFDGFAPEPRQRVLRFFGSCLSSCTVLGLLWSLADEESLTWQDHISRTFPTPLALDQQIFRRV